MGLLLGGRGRGGERGWGGGGSEGPAAGREQQCPLSSVAQWHVVKERDRERELMSTKSDGRGGGVADGSERERGRAQRWEERYQRQGSARHFLLLYQFIRSWEMRRDCRVRGRGRKRWRELAAAATEGSPLDQAIPVIMYLLLCNQAATVHSPARSALSPLPRVRARRPARVAPSACLPHRPRPDMRAPTLTERIYYRLTWTLQDLLGSRNQWFIDVRPLPSRLPPSLSS